MARGILRAFGKNSGRQARGALLAAALSLGVSASVGWAAETGKGFGEGGGNEPALRAASPEARAERYVEAVSAYLTQFSGRVLGGLSMTGSVAAADLGDAVEILFPGVAIAGGRIRLGDVAARARPLEAPRYDVDFSWDGHAGIYANGAMIGAIDVADPRLKGQWDSELRAFARFDVETGPIVWTRGDESVLSAKALSVNRKLLPNGKGGWEEDSVLRVAGLDLGGWEGGAYARIGDARIEFRRTSFDPAAWLFLSDAVGVSRAGGKANETSAAPAGEPETDGRGAARFADVEIAGDDGMLLALGELALRVDYREKSGNVFVDMGAPRLPGTPSRFLPERVVAEIEVLGFPLGRFFAEMGDERFWRAHGRKAPAGRRFLSRAGRGSEFRISRFKVGIPPAEANVHGTLRPDGAGWAVGELRARVTGLDDYLETLPKSRSPVAIITVLKGLGRPVAGKDGRIAYVYDIDLSADGAVAVNGLPLSPPAE